MELICLLWWKKSKEEDIQIERSFLAVMSPDFDSSNLPDHIKYLPRKQAAEYLALSESTLIRYHENGRLKWITREIEPLFILEKRLIILKKTIKKNINLD